MACGALIQAGLAAPRTPIDVREVALQRLERDPFLLQHSDASADGMILLTTCERIELIAEVDSDHGTASVRSWLSALLGSSRLVDQYAQFRTGRDAAMHFMRVTAGLESRILGEPHVLGQVKNAYAQSLGEGRLSPCLAALGRAAISCGKRVRTESAINVRQDSIVTLVRDRLRQELGGLAGRRVSILGTGQLAAELAQACHRCDAEITITSLSSLDRARSLAQTVEGESSSIVRFHRTVAEADAVIAATQAKHGMIMPDTFRRRVRTDTLPVIDLSVPRVFRETCARHSGVKLFDLSCFAAGRRDGDAVRIAEGIVKQEVERFERWQRSRHLAKTIKGVIQEKGGHAGNRNRTGSREIHECIMKIKAGAAA
ncbi:MAG: NAD(P)-binding domain-containing protein [Phycisphaerae bacterium]